MTRTDAVRAPAVQYITSQATLHSYVYAIRERELYLLQNNTNIVMQRATQK